MTELLSSNEEAHWAALVGGARDEITSGDAHGLDRLLMAYGGMGSLNDLYLAPQFDALRSEAWSLATELRRQLNRS